MRILGAISIVLLGLSGVGYNAAPARAQAAGDITGSLPPPAAAPRTSAVPPAAAKSLKDSYIAIPLRERTAIQADLVWAGLYSGPINGEYSDQFVNAVRAFQRQNKTRQTGVLNPAEREALGELVRPMQEQVGWRLVQDAVTGAKLGVPIKLAPYATTNKTGSLWSSAQGQVRIETFRITEPSATLADVFARMKSEPAERRVEQQALRGDSFAIIGMQGLKKFHVRAFAHNSEIRGITILYDQAVEGVMDPLVVPMTHAYQPFAGKQPAATDDAAIKRNVEYGTGFVVSAVGHVVTDRRVVEGCQIIVIPGIGHAERLAEDRDHDLALVRVYGAEDLVALALLGEPPKGNDLIMLGIADPQSQAGNAAISATPTKVINTPASGGTISSPSQMPASGFAGAVALDKFGRFFGMVGMKPAVVAGTGAAAPKATIVPAETIRNFIEANYVAPSSGQAGTEHAKASIVRVICVRK